IPPAPPSAGRAVAVRGHPPATAGLRSGLYGKAEFDRGDRTVVSVPKAALVERGQVASVYVVDDAGEAHLRIVTLGKERDGRVEVLSGLAEGERVVIDGASRLT